MVFPRKKLVLNALRPHRLTDVRGVRIIATLLGMRYHSVKYHIPSVPTCAELTLDVEAPLVGA